MRPITWAFNAAVVVGVLLSAVTGAVPSAAAERAVNGTATIDQVAREAASSSAASASSMTTTTTTTTTTTANHGRAKQHYMSSRSSVKSSISPPLEQRLKFKQPTAENDEKLKKTHSAEQRNSTRLPEADDEDNMVMSEQETRHLKPTQKKLEQKQHQKNVEKIIGEAQFDIEHHLDNIPSTFSSSDTKTEHQELPKTVTMPVFEGSEPSVLRQILEFLGIEDFLVMHHLRDADETVDATLQKNQKPDDEMLIVKSVKVNVRKI